MKLYISAALLASAALASAATFTDENTWRTAVGTYALDTFESYSTPFDMDVNAGLGLDFRQLTAKPNQPTVQNASFTGGATVSGTNVLLNDNDNTLPGGGDIIADAIVGLTGFGVWNTGGDDTVQIRAYDAGGALLESITSGFGTEFVGVTSATTIARIEISGIGGNGYFTLDDMQTSVVPEPMTMLGLAGFAALAARRRRKA